MCAAIASHRPPELSPAWGKLYSAAVERARAVLRAKWKYSAGDASDIVQNVLAGQWREVVEADNPLALFTTMLVNRAISDHRRRERTQVTDPEVVERLSEAARPPTVVVDGVSLDLQRVSRWLREHLSERDWRIFMRRMQEEPSAEVAADEKLTTDHVDQIVSRAKKAVRGAFL